MSIVIGHMLDVKHLAPRLTAGHVYRGLNIGSAARAALFVGWFVVVIINIIIFKALTTRTI